jgi:hypothetical protein
MNVWCDSSDDGQPFVNLITVSPVQMANAIRCIYCVNITLLKYLNKRPGHPTWCTLSNINDTLPNDPCGKWMGIFSGVHPLRNTRENKVIYTRQVSLDLRQYWPSNQGDLREADVPRSKTILTLKSNILNVSTSQVTNSKISPDTSFLDLT